MILEKTCRDIDPSVEFVHLESVPETRVSMSQIARLFAAKLPWIQDRDLIMTSDADIVPISRTLYDQIGPEGVTILNSDCCGKFRHSESLPEVVMYPITNIAATKKIWLALMEFEDDGVLQEQYIQFWLEKHYGKRVPTEPLTKGSDTWYMDQLAVSVQIAKHKNSIQVVKMPRASRVDRIDRSFQHTWPSKLEHSALLNKTDAHLFMPAFDQKIWPEMYNLMTRLLRDEDANAVLIYWFERVSERIRVLLDQSYLGNQIITKRSHYP
jgi:hypothetical protein